jgi:hypothetical protein
VTALLLLYVWGCSQALADCPEGLRPCLTVSESVEGLEAAEDPEVVEVMEATSEEIVLDLDLTLDDPAEPVHAARPPYWYEWATDLLWVPGEVLHLMGILGSDHRDAAALGVLYAILHRLWMLVYTPLAPLVSMIRRRLGIREREEMGGEDVEALISWRVSEVLDEHLSETQREINLLRTQNEILQKQVAHQQAANVGLRDASSRLLASAYGAAGYPPGGDR